MLLSFDDIPLLELPSLPKMSLNGTIRHHDGHGADPKRKAQREDGPISVMGAVH